MSPPNTVSLPNIHIPQHKNITKKLAKNVSLLQPPQMAVNNVIVADSKYDDVDGGEGVVGDDGNEDEDGAEIEDNGDGGEDVDDVGDEDDAVASGEDIDDGDLECGIGGMDADVRRGRWQQ